MSATVTVVNRFVQGDRFCRNGTLTLGTYAGGGIAVTAANFELTLMKDLDVRPSGGYVTAVSKTSDTAWTIKLYLQDYDLASADAPLVEVGSVDVSAAVFNWKAEGK